MTNPTPLDAAQLFELIRNSELALVFVSVHSRHRFNRPLATTLAAEHQDIAFAEITLRKLLLGGPSVLRFLHQGLRGCRAPVTLGVLPGYYLFRRAELIAWDAGLPALADVSALARSAALGAIWSGVSNDMSFIGQALEWAADQVAAERLSAVFRQAIAGAQRAYTRRESEPPPREDVYWAYQMLGVLPTASDREVHEAWRRRRREAHPDHAGDDPVEFERRSRISRDINRARDVITNHRYPGTRGATHAWAS